MSNKETTFLDTDLHIFRLDPDPSIRSHAEDIFAKKRPTGMSAFSLVELKGNYVADLILLHNKVSRSGSLQEAFARVRSTGGRKAMLMLGQLILLISDDRFKAATWVEVRGQILTHLDAQIPVAWEAFKRSVDHIFDDFLCSRAAEGIEDVEGHWSATIAHCRANNTKCKIVEFLSKHRVDLINLLSYLSTLASGEMSDELHKIRKVVERTTNGAFPWQDNLCRQIGDLLIGLQSKIGKALISSNHKEHNHLSKGLGYLFEEFPVSKIRLK